MIKIMTIIIQHGHVRLVLVNQHSALRLQHPKAEFLMDLWEYNTYQNYHSDITKSLFTFSLIIITYMNFIIFMTLSTSTIMDKVEVFF